MLKIANDARPGIDKRPIKIEHHEIVAKRCGLLSIEVRVGDLAPCILQNIGTCRGRAKEARAERSRPVHHSSFLAPIPSWTVRSSKASGLHPGGLPGSRKRPAGYLRISQHSSTSRTWASP